MAYTSERTPFTAVYTGKLGIHSTILGTCCVATFASVWNRPHARGEGVGNLTHQALDQQMRQQSLVENWGDRRMHVHTRLCIRKRHAPELEVSGRSVATCTLALFPSAGPEKRLNCCYTLSLSHTHTMPKQRDKPANIIPAPLPLFSQLGAFRCPRNIGVGTMVQLQLLPG